MRPKKRDELHGGFAFLVPLALSLIPMAVDLGMAEENRKKAEREQAEAQRRYDAEVQEQQKQQLVNTQVAQRARAEQVRLQTQQTQQLEQQRQAQVQRENLQKQQQSSALQSQARTAEAQRASALQTETQARRSQEQESAFAQRKAVSAKELASLQNAQRQQKEFFENDMKRRLQLLQQPPAQQKIVRRLPTTKISFGRTGKIGSGVDTDLLAYIKDYYGVSMREAKQIYKNYF